VKKAALRGKCPKKIKVLAVPWTRRIYKPYDPSIFYQVKRSALTAQPTQWDLQASLPKIK